jgi:uncharacterized membrane protein (UPF0127 family)
MSGMLAPLLASVLLAAPPADVKVEVVSEPAALRRGLQGHRPLLPGEGMLFVLPAPEQARFWMRDMTFAIDIVFIDAAGTIDSVAAGAPPCTADPCAVYRSRSEVTHVLEVPAGFAGRSALAPGAPLTLDLERGFVRRKP